MKPKRVVVFVEKVSGTPTIIGRKTLRKDTDSIRYKRGAYIVDTRRVAYNKGKTLFYVVDVKDGQLTYGDNDNPVSPELIDMILNKQVAKQLVAGLNTANMNTMTIIMLVVGLVAGIPLGIVLAPIVGGLSG